MDEYTDIKRNYEECGRYCSNPDVELIRLSNGNVYALYGWNGERFLHCWQVDSKFMIDVIKTDITLVPIYRYQLIDDFDFEKIEENSEEWYLATEIVDYEIR